MININKCPECGSDIVEKSTKVKCPKCGWSYSLRFHV